MSIKDIGKGFDISNLDLSESLGGNGIKNMQIRAENIHAKLSIQNVLNTGTIIIFSLEI
ncbi:MAG: hypothetical protein ABJB05_13145 [Parafilimonas sp.]